MGTFEVLVGSWVNGQKDLKSASVWLMSRDYLQLVGPGQGWRVYGAPELWARGEQPAGVGAGEVG